MIGENWVGEPLTSYTVILEFIRHTKSEDGFRCLAVLDRTPYATGVKVAKEAKALDPKPLLLKKRKIFSLNLLTVTPSLAKVVFIRRGTRVWFPSWR